MVDNHNPTDYCPYGEEKCASPLMAEIVDYAPGRVKGPPPGTKPPGPPGKPPKTSKKGSTKP